MQDKLPVLAVVGPTASGKSRLAVQLAKWLKSEVVSADSMQIYQGMPIGTAQPTAQEQDGVPHHLIGFAAPTQPFSAADYVRLAGDCLAALHARGKIPVLAGGTGLYVRALLQNFPFEETDRNEALRCALAQKAERQGNQALVEELRAFDPESARRIDPCNLPRLIRAIEIYRTTGHTMTEQLERSRQTPSPYLVCMIGLDYADRSVLYDRINRRVDAMLEQGLLEEAQRVLSQPGGQTARQAIGYKELAPYFSGEISRKEAVDKMKQETRRYAKRQRTWFRREPQVHWLYPDVCGEQALFPAARDIVRNTFAGHPFLNESAKTEEFV